MPSWSRFAEIVRSHQRFLLTSHVRPDADALGSELAMAAVLESLGKEVLICNAFAAPPSLRFLDPAGKLKQLGADPRTQQLDRYEVWMVLDTSAWVQLGTMAERFRESKSLKLVIDHHVSQDDLGAELFKNVEAEATGRLVIEAADALGVAVTPEITRPALAALATDTGWFRFSSTSAETLRLAARLVETGAAPDELYRNLYENDSLGRLRLIGAALGRVEVELDGRFAHTHLTIADFKAAGALASDSEDIINMTLSIGGTRFAVILVEQAGEKFKVSFRSRCHLDCSELAGRFGGGGHRKAAGALVEGPLEDAQKRVYDVVRAAMATDGVCG